MSSAPPAPSIPTTSAFAGFVDFAERIWGATSGARLVSMTGSRLLSASVDESPAAAWDWIARGSTDGRDCYINIATRDASRLKRRPADGLFLQRGGAADCIEIQTIALDLDLKGEAHATGFVDEAHALEYVARVPFEPSAIVRSGNGLQVFFALDEPVAAPEYHERWEPRLAATFARLGDELGATTDATFRVASMLRIPGTTNNKGEVPKSVEVLR